MGESQMFAEDDAIYNENHIATVTCKSAYGSLMAISVAVSILNIYVNNT